jgi:hypothetical protein
MQYLRSPHPALTVPLLQLVASSSHRIQSQDILVELGLAIFALRVASGQEYTYISNSFVKQCQAIGVQELPPINEEQEHESESEEEEPVESDDNEDVQVLGDEEQAEDEEDDVDEEDEEEDEDMDEAGGYESDDDSDAIAEVSTPNATSDSAETQHETHQHPLIAAQEQVRETDELTRAAWAAFETISGILPKEFGAKATKELLDTILSTDRLDIDHKRLLVQLNTLTEQFQVPTEDILASKDVWTTVKAKVAECISFISIGLHTFGVPTSTSAFDAASLYARLLTFVSLAEHVQYYDQVHKNIEVTERDWNVWLLEEITQGYKDSRHMFQVDVRHQLRRCVRQHFATGHNLYDQAWTDRVVQTAHKFLHQESELHVHLKNLTTYLREVVTTMCEDYIKRGGLVEEGRMGSDGIVSALGQVYDGIMDKLFNNSLEGLLENPLLSKGFDAFVEGILVHDDPRVRSFASQALTSHVEPMASWEAKCLTLAMTNMEQVNAKDYDVQKTLNTMLVTSSVAVLLGRIAVKDSNLEIGATGLAEIVRSLGMALLDQTTNATEEVSVQIDRIVARVLNNSGVDAGGNDEEAFVFFAEGVLIRTNGLLEQPQVDIKTLTDVLENVYYVVGACRSFTSPLRRDRSVLHVAQRVQRIHVRLIELLLCINNAILSSENASVRAMLPAICRLGSFVSDVLRGSCSGSEYAAISVLDNAKLFNEQLLAALGETRLPKAINLASHDLVRGTPADVMVNRTTKNHKSEVFTEDETVFEIRPQIKKLISQPPPSVLAVINKGLKANDVRMLLNRHDHSDV